MSGKRYFYRIGQSDKACAWMGLPSNYWGWPEWAQRAYLRGFNGLSVE